MDKREKHASGSMEATYPHREIPRLSMKLAHKRAKFAYKRKELIRK